MNSACENLEMRKIGNQRMKKLNRVGIRKMYFLVILAVTALIFSCTSQPNETAKSNDSLQSAEKISPSAYDYSKILKNQDSLVGDFGWTRKHELDLNDDGINEEFLAVSGYSRGMDYVLFTKIGKNWKLLSGTETIPSAEAGVRIEKKTKNGWHDFIASQGSGRGGIIESYFTWDGQKYVLKEQKEVKY